MSVESRLAADYAEVRRSNERLREARREAARQEIVDLRIALHAAETEVAKWRARYGDPDQLDAPEETP